MRNRLEASSRYVRATHALVDRKSTRLNSSHSQISYAVFCLKKKRENRKSTRLNSSHSAISYTVLCLTKQQTGESLVVGDLIVHCVVDVTGLSLLLLQKFDLVGWTL